MKTARRQWIMFTLECPDCGSALASPHGSLNWSVFEANPETIDCEECKKPVKVPVSK
jgi:endogenous inhibitor of DNA gyrase (YacG/DUF329 family)